MSSSPEYTINVPDRFDAFSSGEVANEINAYLDVEENNSLVIDLSNINFIDSAALATLVQALRKTKAKNGQLTLKKPKDPNAFRIFELTKFDSIFDFE